MLSKKLLSKILRKFEKFGLKRCERIVVTSPAFANEYFSKIQNIPKCKIDIIENKLESSLKVYTKPLWESKRPLVIGYFGLLRCLNSLNILAKLAKISKGNVKIILRGLIFTDEDVKERINKMTNIRYFGEYLVPDDLPKIYCEIDIVWGAWLPNNKNEDASWKMVNRYYEAGYFKKPLIVQCNTQDGIKVKKNNIGLLIDILDENKSVNQILEIKPEDIIEWTENLIKMPINNFVYTNEHSQLMGNLYGKKIF